MASQWIDTPQSSNVRGFGYDKETRELTVEYKGGKRYVYSGVSAARVKALASAESVGSYINQQIIPRYPVRKENE